MNCDRIAPFYRWFEYVAFGRQLERHRTAFLNTAREKKTALVLGDGDGRFLSVLARSYPQLKIDCIEISAGMLSEARRRSSPNVRLIQADALQLPLEPNRYDIVFTHFFLDCFNTAQLSEFLKRLQPALRPNATWILSEFARPGGWRGLYAFLWLKTMYFFFRVLAGLRTTELPDYRAALSRAGFRLQEQQTSHLGMIVSQHWAN